LTSFPTSTYSGTAVLKNGVVSFDETSYTDWDTQFSSYFSTPGTAPATTLFKSESINLSSYLTSSQFKIRFRLAYDDSTDYYGWLLDNIKIIGTPKVTWTATEPIYTDAALSTAYVATTNAQTVYVRPYETTTYTATADVNGCTKSDAKSYTVDSNIWNGTVWSEGTPPASLTQIAVIDGNITLSNDIEACSCIVKSGRTLIFLPIKP
jgi:hypothetical protein